MPLSSTPLLSDGYGGLLPGCKLDGAWNWSLTSLSCYIFTPHSAFTERTGTSSSPRCVEENLLTLATWGLLLITKYAFHTSWYPVPFVVRGWRGSHVSCWMLTSHLARVTYVTQPVLDYSTAMLLEETRVILSDMNYTSLLGSTSRPTVQPTASAGRVQYKPLLLPLTAF